MTDPAAIARAEALVDLGRPSEAETMLRALLAQDPENPRVLRVLTRALLGGGDNHEAYEVAKRAVAADPESEHSHRLLAIAAGAAGHRTIAERAGREAVKLGPNLWQTHYTLGSVLSKNFSSKEEALACARRATELAPHESMPHNLAGICLNHLGHRDQAVAEYEEAIRLNPNNAMALNNLAAFRMNTGKLTEASAILRSGLSASPQEAMLRQNYDIVLLKLMRRLYVALYLVFLAQLALASNEAPYVARVGVGLALVAVCVGAAYRVTRQLPRGAHLWARGLLRRVAPPHRILVVRFLLVLAVDLLVAAVPADAAITVGGAGIVAFVALAIAATAAGRKRRTGAPNLRERSF